MLIFNILDLFHNFLTQNYKKITYNNRKEIIFLQKQRKGNKTVL